MIRLLSVQLYIKTAVHWNDSPQTAGRKTSPFMKRNTAGKWTTCMDGKMPRRAGSFT